MASPHVAGLAALLLEDDPERDPAEVRSRLVSTADDVGEDVFLQGGGQVDARGALETDLLVHDPVTDFGIYQEDATDTATVTLENVGDDALEVAVDASLENVQDGESRDDSVSVTPSSLSLGPDESADVEVEIDTAGAFGWNSGVVTFETDGASHRAIFGFTRGIGVTVEKIPHEDSGSIEDDGLWLFSEDATVNESPTGPFADGETFTTTLFTDETTLSIWSWGELEERGEPAMTVATDVDVEDGARVVLDERDVVARTLDTAAFADRKPFRTHMHRVDLYASLEDLGISYGLLAGSADGIPTVHFSPVDEDDPTNVSTEYLFESAESRTSSSIDAPEAFHLFYPTRSVEAPEDVIEVDPDRLATEEFTYHRSYDQSYGFSPFLAPTDDEHFPSVRIITLAQSIGDEVDEQTWYRSPEVAEYREGWSYGGLQVDRSEQWEPDRTGFVAEPGETYRAEFERDPILSMLYWDVDDDQLTLSGQFHTDQSPQQFVRTNFGAPFSDWNEAIVSFDGTPVASGLLPTFGFDFDAEIDPGTTVTVELEGSAIDSVRHASTASTYEATHEPGTASEPPEVDRVEVAGLTRANEVPAGPIVAFVDVDDPAGGGVALDAYYAASGAVSDPPFDGADGWTAADVIYDDGDTFGVLLDATGHDGVDLAFSAVDADGNAVETTAFDAIDVREGADVTASIDVRAETIHAGSRRRVPVVIEATDDVDPREIDAGTLRFGAADAVAAGDGAAPISVQRLGTGDLQAIFPASGGEFACDRDVTEAQLVGELEDGTAFSGVDLVGVRCE